MAGFPYINPLILVTMWYFVEKNGRCVKATKHLFAAQIACAGIADSGVSPDTLRIMDSEGKEHPKVGV